MLKYNYHTHTYRCNHATGTDEDYVIEALSIGMRGLGFSDHIMLPDFSEPTIRGEYSCFQNYLDSIDDLKKSYDDRIKIYKGLEAEGFAYYFPYYKELISTGTVDYLILGNHSMMNNKKKIIAHFGQPTASSIHAYKDTAIAAMKTMCFSCFAHPDYFMSSLPVFDRDVMKVSAELIEASIIYDIPLEINIGGIRNGKKQIGDKYRYIYPNSEFFLLAKKMGAKFILGLDAHGPSQINDEQANCTAVRFVHDLGLQLIQSLDFKKGS